MSVVASIRGQAPAGTKRRVTFLVPASPTPAFFSQIAAFRLALDRLPWTRWQPSILASFGGGFAAVDSFELKRWRPYLDDVTMVFPHARPHDGLYDGQVDELYRAAPADADVLVRVDADMLPTADLEPMLDFVHERSAMAGVIAHYRFPAPEGVGNREAWEAVAAHFPAAQLQFDYEYSLTTDAFDPEERVAPFYLNAGLVFWAREYFDQLAPLYLETRPQLVDKLVDPYYAGQISLTLASSQIPLPTVALPLRFNFPNDLVAAEQYPEEMEAATIIHYLRDAEFDRQKIFRWPEMYAHFMQQPLNPANERFRNAVRSLLGDEYPFPQAAGARAPQPRPPALTLPASVIALTPPTPRLPRVEPAEVATAWLRERLQSGIGQGHTLELVAGGDIVLSNTDGFAGDVLDIDAVGDHLPPRPYAFVCSVGAVGRLPRRKRAELLDRAASWIEPGGRMLFAVDLVGKSDFLLPGADRDDGDALESPSSISDFLEAIEGAGLRGTDRVVHRGNDDATGDVLLVEASFPSD